MRLELSDVLSWLPEAGILLIISFLVFVSSGWVSSVMVASKFKWLWLFALFPLTNPSNGYTKPTQTNWTNSHQRSLMAYQVTQ